MSGQKRPADCSASSSSGAPPEKRREREGEDGGPGISTAAGGSTAVETVIKLGGVSNSVRGSALSLYFSLYIYCLSLFFPAFYQSMVVFFFFRKNKTSRLSKLKTESWEKPLTKDR